MSNQKNTIENIRRGSFLFLLALTLVAACGKSSVVGPEDQSEPTEDARSSN